MAGSLDDELLADVDVLVLPHCSTDEWEATTGVGSPIYAEAEIDAIERFVRGGGGLVVLAETEQPKYGNSLAQIAARFGVEVVNATVQDPSARIHDVPTWIRVQPVADARWDVWAGVAGAAMYRAGVLDPAGGGEDEVAIVARTSANAAPPAAGLVALVTAGAGRVAVLTDSDLFGDDSIEELGHRRFWRNLVVWTAAGATASAQRDRDAAAVVDDPAWQELVAAIEEAAAAAAQGRVGAAGGRRGDFCGGCGRDQDHRGDRSAGAALPRSSRPVDRHGGRLPALAR